jgi:GH15 family glucan-1,4-alpha-glucosidase
MVGRDSKEREVKMPKLDFQYWPQILDKCSKCGNTEMEAVTKCALMLLNHEYCLGKPLKAE